MADIQNTLLFLITIIAILITLIFPVPIPEEYKFIIITAFILLFLGITLSNFGGKLNEHEEKLKIHEQLIDIKKDIGILSEKIKWLEKET